jgi:hypothetical protein
MLFSEVIDVYFEIKMNPITTACKGNEEVLNTASNAMTYLVRRPEMRGNSRDPRAKR